MAENVALRAQLAPAPRRRAPRAGRRARRARRREPALGAARLSPRFAPGGAPTRRPASACSRRCSSPMTSTDCARRAVHWLGEHARGRGGYRGRGRPEGTRLARDRRPTVSPAERRRALVDLEDRRHPLVNALAEAAGGRPSATATVARPRRGVRARGVRRGMPLRTLDVGTTGRSVSSCWRPCPPPRPDVRWIAEILGQKLARAPLVRRPRGCRAPAASRACAAREHHQRGPGPRPPDRHRGPPDARQRPRRALFAADEDQSEGRRRAVALNNMLFSVGPVAQRVRGRESWRRELPLVDPVEGSDLLFELLSTVVDDPREGTGHRLRPPQHHRPPARHRGDRGELPPDPDRRGRGPRRARPARSRHRLGRRPDRRHRPRRQHRPDERAGRAPLHRRSRGTGEGIPADKLEQIFSAFVTSKAAGTGMGLAISRTIVESHDGKLWAESNPGTGATFHFTLPGAGTA